MWKRRCWAYEVIVYIERRYLVMIVRWMGNHASTCGVIGKGVTRDDDPVHDLLGRTGNLLGNLLWVRDAV